MQRTTRLFRGPKYLLWGRQAPSVSIFATMPKPTRHFSTRNTRKKGQKSNLWRSKAAYITLGTLVAGSGAYYVDQTFLSSTGYRSVKAFYVLMWIAWEYSRNSESYERLEDLHEVTAEALLRLLMENKGLYIKLGQAIANQGTIFPIAYQKRFYRLYDEAPLTPWSHVHRVLTEELGPNYGDIVTVEREPVASASIAQVHRGKLATGEDVAVKVQHHYMNKQIKADLFMYRLISHIYEYVFELPMTVFTRYVLEQMLHETNFVKERENGDRLARMVREDPTARSLNVHIPKTFPEALTERVLVTEWIDGTSMISRQRLEQNGYNVATAMKQYFELFGRQFFQYGFVHSDPHPGNLLVRFDARKRQQLVLLDHGLYILLPPKFQRQFRDLWQDIFSLNLGGIQRVSEEWGIGSSQMFTAMVTLRPPEKTGEGGRRRKVGSNSNLDAKDGTEKEHSFRSHQRSTSDIHTLFKDFLSDEKRFPMELLFLMRTQRMMQNLNLQMGSPVNRINLLTWELVNASLQLVPDWTTYWSLWRVKTVLFFSEVVFWIFHLKQWWSGRHDSSDGFERYIMEVTKDTTRAMGLEVWEGDEAVY